LRQNVAGLDIGTSSIKLLWRDKQNQIQTESTPNTGLVNNGCEIEPDRILHDLKLLFRKSQIPENAIKAVGLSTFFPGFIAVDQNGTALTNIITWLDPKGQKALQTFRNSLEDPNEYHRRTGCVLHAAHTIWKILWLKSEHASIFEKTHKFLTLAEYIIFKLTGEFATSISHASTTGYFNQTEMQWDRQLLSYMEISESQLPECCPITQQIALQKNIAEELGLSRKPDLVMGGGDGILANIGSGCLSSKKMCSSLGTSGALRITSEAPNPSPNIWNYRLDHQNFVSGYAINAGYATFKSVEKLLNRPDILKDINEMGENCYNEILFIPFIHGERGPEYNPHQSGSFSGISSRHTAQDLIKAVVEGVFFNLYDCYLRMSEIESPKELVAAGKYARNTKLVQLQADIFNLEIKIPNIEESSAFGAYLIALETISNNFKIQDHDFGFISTVYPNQERHSRYREKFNSFQKLYQITGMPTN